MGFYLPIYHSAGSSIYFGAEDLLYIFIWDNDDYYAHEKRWKIFWVCQKIK